MWNKYVFSPDWINRYIFCDSSFNIEQPQLYANASLRYIEDGILINIFDQRLIFGVTSPDRDHFQTIVEKARIIARLLPYTPIQGYGINHVFECPNDEIKEGLFRSANLTKILESYNIENNCSLNVTIIRNVDKVIFDCNYHHPINSLEQLLIELEDNSIYSALINAQNFIESTYLRGE